MESVNVAARSIFPRAQRKVWRLALRVLRDALWAVDGWLQREEARMRDAGKPLDPELDPTASAARERVFIHDGCKSPGKTTPLNILITKDLPACPPLDARATALAVRTTGARPRLSAARMGPRRQRNSHKQPVPGVPARRADDLQGQSRRAAFEKRGARRRAAASGTGSHFPRLRYQHGESGVRRAFPQVAKDL
jgi:hypothetical protein